MKKHGWTKRILSLVLSALMVMPAWQPALAGEPENVEILTDGTALPAAIHTADGEVEIPEDWNEVYPYGTFAFGNYQADVAEPGALTQDGGAIPQTIRIPVYRLGGTVGKATAKVSFSPAVTLAPDGDGTLYDYAASGRDDLLIEYEAPSPIAAVQPVGVPEELSGIRAAEDAAVAFDGEPDAGSLTEEDELILVLSGAPDAEEIQWQFRAEDGDWQDVDGGDASALPMLWGDIWDFGEDCWKENDFRCLYSLDGVRYCTESLFGVPFEENGIPETDADFLPKDYASGEDGAPEYAVLDVEGEFDAYEFELTYADGETVKYIRVTAYDDEIPELPEFALFTITGCDGGDLSDTCNTLTLMVSDNDPGEPSALGFVEELVRTDRNNDETSVTVRRDGGKSYQVAVNYRTVDGTALAGVDYAPLEGTLAFAGSIDEIRIPVQLIRTESSEPKTFSIELYDVTGGGPDDLCVLDFARSAVTVEIGGEGAPAEAKAASDEAEPADSASSLLPGGINLATVLAESSGGNAADRVTLSDEAMIRDTPVLEGDYIGKAADPDGLLTASLTLPDAAELASLREVELMSAIGADGVQALPVVVRPQSYLVSSGYKFSRDDIDHYETSNYWRDWEIIVGAKRGESDIADVVNYVKRASSELEDVGKGKGKDENGKDTHISYGTQYLGDWVEEGDPWLGGTGNIFRINANFKGSFSLPMTAEHAKLFGQMEFAAYLKHVGEKSLTARKDRFLQPNLYFYSGNLTGTSWSGINLVSTNFNISGQSKRVYYWYSAGMNGSAWKAADGANQGVDSWPGLTHIKPVNLQFGKSFGLSLDYIMRGEGGGDWLQNDDGYDWDERVSSDTVVDILAYRVKRREFTQTNKGIRYVIYTANDKDEARNNGWSPVTNEALYKAITPSVSIVQGEGGVSASGNLYVGTKLQISLPTNGNYTIESVTLTETVGNKVYEMDKVTQSGDYTWIVELLRKDMSESELGGSFQLNVFLARKQFISVDILPSVPRLQNDPMTPDSKMIAPTWSNFHYGTGTKVVEVGYSTLDAERNGLYFGETLTKELEQGGFSTGKNSAGTYTYGSRVENIQWVNFHQDAEDVVLFNKHAYRGDERIPITSDCFSGSTLNFLFYDSDCLDAVSPMEVKLDHVDLYYDGDGDGIISGTTDDEGIFTVTAPDVKVGPLDGEYPDAYFAPTVIRDDETKEIIQVRQYFMKAFFSLRPRAYQIPAGASAEDRAQVLPAFVSLITNPAQEAELTPEEQSYRYVAGAHTDGLPMYGADATGMMNVDIPLGGDVAMIVKNTVTNYKQDKDGKVSDLESETVWTWVPDYRGNLLVPFDSPTPVVNKNNVTGGPVPIAGETPVLNADGSFTYSGDGEKRVNGYLGSFAGRSAFAMGVQMQVIPLANIGSLSDVRPESIVIGKVSTTPSPNNLMNMEAGEDPNATEGETPNDSTGFPEFGADLGVELPSLNFDLGDYATLIIDGYQVGFSIGIPIYKYEDTSYSGSEKTTKQDDGSTRKEWVNPETGQKETVVTSADGKTVSTTYPKQQDPNDPDITIEKTVVVRTKPDGSKTEQVIENSYTKVPDPNDPTKTIEKVTKTEHAENPQNTPAETAKTKREKAKEGFLEANGQMQTLINFVSSVWNRAHGQAGKVKDFMKGAFEDDSLKQAKNGNTTSKKVSVTFTVQIAIMFEYNPIDNGYYFKNAGLAGKLGFEVTVQHRFTVCPLLYVYVKFGAEVEVGIGVTCIREAKEGPELNTIQDGLTLNALTEGKPVIFKLDMTKKDKDTVRGFHLNLKGRVFMDVYPDYPGTGVAALTAGALSGDGSTNEVLFKEYNKVVYIRLTPIGKGVESVSDLKPVIGASSKVVFDGLSITPGLSLEAGVGVGMELLKFELFVRTNIAMTMTMGGYSEDTEKYEGFYISDFQWALAAGFHATVLFINYSMDVIGISVQGAETGGTGGYFTWNIMASAADGMKVLWTKTTYTKGGKSYDEPPVDSGKGTNSVSVPVSDAESLVHIAVQRDVAPTQSVAAVIETPYEIMSIPVIRDGGAEIQSIKPTGTDDFELSGFNTSGDARKLVDGLANGYAYKLFSAAGENYILYPLSLGGCPQLVMSRVVMTGNLAEGTGLANPVDSTSDIPYIRVENDGLTDFDFMAEAEDSLVTVVWTGYEVNEKGEQILSVKRASIDLSSDAAFSAPVTLSEGTDAYRFQPSVSGGAAVWGESSGSGQAQNNALKAWLTAKNAADGLTPEILDAGTTDNGLLASAVYRWNISSQMNELSGDHSVLTAQNARYPMKSGEIIENLECGTVDGTLYALFSTSFTGYVDGNGKTVEAGKINKDTELGTIRRLYLTRLTADAWEEPQLIQTVIDFDSCDDRSLDTAPLKDGVYVNSSLTRAQADPYFGNLRFLTAKLDGEGDPETFLLFEMGGNTYLMRQADLLSLMSGGAGSLVPLFESTTGAGAVIGSDSKNMAVVYTAPVADTVNNAVYAAWWDAEEKTWGSPVLLAMNHLQVREDAEKYDLSPDERSKAYLGEVTGNKAYDEYIGLLKGGALAHAKGDMDSFTFSDLQMTTRAVPNETDPRKTDTQLLILTQGSRTALKKQTFMPGAASEFTTVIPDGDTDVGFYAIAFGEGKQALSMGSISFANSDFTAGSQIVGEAGFVNAGTTAIRAGDSHPATVELVAVPPKESTMPSVTLARWFVNESIPSGGEVKLAFKTDELGTTLPAGTTIALTVSENSEYFGKYAFTETLGDLFTIRDLAELSFGSFDLKLTGVKGEQAQLTIDASVLNNGTKTADNVFIQFTYDTGAVDSLGNPIYKPVPITGSDLETGKAEPQFIGKAYSVNDVSASDSYGVYYLADKFGGTTIAPGYLRRISKTLCVPVSCFLEGEEKTGLHIRAEIFSDADSTNLSEDKVYSSEHAEYNGDNNRAETTVKHGTFFEVPARISTALGNTLNLPVTIRSTSRNPRIVLNEVSDGSADWTPNMGIAYFDEDRNVIVAAANSTAEQRILDDSVPTGVLQIRDESTNSIAAITYQIGKMAEGINIYRNDASFTFLRADGSPVDLYASSASARGWAFPEKVPALAWTGGKKGEIPMNADLSRALEDGATVSFETVADTMTLYFTGNVTIESDVFGSYGPFTKSPAFVEFTNPKGKSHTVTITAAAGTELDRYTATYKVSPVSDTDSDSPQILWNRSAPATASVMPGDQVPMTCYIVDGTGIQSVSFNGNPLSENTSPALVKLDSGLWYFDYTFTDNGKYDVSAMDLAGNSSELPGKAMWFNGVLTVGAIADAPTFVRGHLSFTDKNGTAVSLTDPLNEIPYLTSSYRTESNETDGAYFFADGVFSDSQLAKDGNAAGWQTVGNGYYLVRVDREDGTWARAVTLISNVDVTDPVLSAVPNEAGDAIDIAASDNSRIVSVKVNGYKIPGMSGRTVSGAFPVDFGGTYTVRVEDDAGNTTEQTITVSVPVSLGGGVSAEADVYSASAKITVDPAKVTGGSYNASESDPDQNRYETSYQFALVKAESESAVPDTSGAAWEDASTTGEESVFTAAESGVWFLAVQDSKGNVSFSGPITVEITGESTPADCLNPGKVEAKVSVTFEGVTDTDEAKTDIPALGHEYGQPKWTWTVGFDSATATFACVREDDTQVINADISSVTEQPTCDKNGKTVYTAAVLFGGKEYRNEKTKTLEATGHDYGLTGFEWAEDGSAATAVFTCSRDTSHVVRSPASVTSAVSVPATCEAAGTTTYTASVTFENVTYTDNKDVKDIPATGHAYALSGWTWTGVTKAEASFVCGHDKSHVVTVEGTIGSEQTDPTDTTAGKIVYTATAVFEGRTYTDQKTVTLPAKGHRYGEPVWEWTGYEKATATFTCDKNDDTQVIEANITSVTTDPECEKEGKTVYTASVLFGEKEYTDVKTVTIPAAGHKAGEPVKENEIKALCEKAGSYENAVYCADCGKELSRTTVTVPALGHDWGDPVYVWAEDNASVTAKSVCRNDPSHTQEETEVTEYKVITEPGPETEGKGRYTVSFGNPLFRDLEKEVVIPPKGYTYGAPVFEWTDDGHVTVTFPAEEDPKGDVTLTDADDCVRITVDIIRETCETDGVTVYTATVTFDDRTYADIFETARPARGHNWGEPVFRWYNNNRSAEAVQTCRNDPAHIRSFTASVNSEELPALGSAPMTTIYTASAVIDGRIYRDTVTVTAPRLILGAPIVPVPQLPGPEKEPEVREPEVLKPDIGEPVREAMPFRDVLASDSFFDDVRFVWDNGIMNGVSADAFDPFGTLTRGMLVTILWRMEGEPAAEYSGVFRDVPAGEWYTDGVEWAAANGIVNGYGDGKYGPSDPLTREQLAAILYRYADRKGYALRTADTAVSDASLVSPWAAGNVLWAVSNGVLLLEDGHVRPTENALRWEIAAAVRAFCEGVAE